MAIFHTKTFLKHDDYMTPKYAWENIPFSKSKDILNRLKELDKPFIMILPSSKINTQYFRLFKNDIQLIIPPKRIHFDKQIDGETPEGWKNSCNFDCFYYCYKMNLPRDIIWLE